ncbi:hypothetical protein [Desulfitobacterium hafniense]|uniref:hypothetical protein n=1 Tax=Desulfitobacterium hafniense TaxID=49338 RepID=UPI00031DA60B|nr:hypothetical protein [Desulfitobacterium hafniense]
MAKLTMICPECNALFEKGLVFEVGADKLETIDIDEYGSQKFVCVTCGYEVTTAPIEVRDESGFPIC